MPARLQRGRTERDPLRIDPRLGDVALRLWELRQGRNLSQRKAAELSGVGFRTISSFEAKWRIHTLKLSQLVRLLDMYGVTLAEFFTARPSNG
jgi:transcriptional regulator with XRE-family HTH domain